MALQVTPVDRVGDRQFVPGPVAARLAAAFRARVEAETS